MPSGSWPFQTKSSSSAIISTSVTGTSYSYKCIQIDFRNPIMYFCTFLLSILHSKSCPAIPPSKRTPDERQKSIVFIANLKWTTFVYLFMLWTNVISEYEGLNLSLLIQVKIQNSLMSPWS